MTLVNNHCPCRSISMDAEYIHERLFFFKIENKTCLKRGTELHMGTGTLQTIRIK